MKLPQSLILHIEKSQDAHVALRPYITAEDIIIDIREHKKETGKTVGIFIEDVRAIQEAVRTAKKHTRTIVCIADAATMTAQAQNALLKLLEEPREGLYFILITSSPHTLLATIRSRCQVMRSAVSTNVDIPSDRKNKIAFMSDGNSSEAQKLAADERYYKRQEERFALAKTLLSGSRLDRLKVAAQLKESREEAMEIIHASLVFSRFLLQRQPSTELLERAAKLLEAERNLEKNGNVRVWLLECVV